MTDAKEAFKRWVFEGNSPCCFPFWNYGPDSVYLMIDWMDEFQAWDVYVEIQKEYEDD